MVNLRLPRVSDEEAIDFILSHLRRGKKNQHPLSDGFAFDLYIPDVVLKYLEPQQEEWRRQNPGAGMVGFQPDTITNSRPFYDAAWSLCIRGILRPGILQNRPQDQRPFMAGAGYDLTPYGREWLAHTDETECLHTEYKRFSELFAVHRNRYCPAYYRRSQ